MPTEKPQKTRCPVCRQGRGEAFCRAYDRYYGDPAESWEILRCADCGYGWTWPQPSAEQLLDLYPPWYMGDTAHTIEEYRSGQLERSRSWKIERRKVGIVERELDGGRILDVGCGDGKFLWALDGGRWQRTGVERGEEIVGLLEQHFPEIRWIAGEIDSPRLEEGSFDAVTLWHVLEHLPRPRQVLSRIARILRPGGWLFLALPGLDSPQARLFRRFWFAFDEVPRHIHHFSKRSLEILLKEAGFEIAANGLYSFNLNIHSLKHSLVHWSEDLFASRIPYYALKPTLFAIHSWEALRGQYGMPAMSARLTA